MIICGTGHRPNKLGGYKQDVIDKLINLAEENIPKDTTYIISGMALGWDQALAQAAINLAIPFHAAVPFQDQDLIWPESSRKKYNYILSKADIITYVSPPGYAPYKMQKRNKYMVDKADIILALYDGSKVGGTFNCINYAKDKNKHIINLWDEWIIKIGVRNS